MHNLSKAVLVVLAVVFLPPEPCRLGEYGFNHPLSLMSITIALAFVAFVVRVTIYTRRVKWLVNRPRIGRIVSSMCLGILAALVLESFAGQIDQRTNLALNLGLFAIGFAAIESAHAALRWRKQNREK
jgi:FlaA1/EpsC-like NDP-sugar epimerase